MKPTVVKIVQNTRAYPGIAGRAPWDNRYVFTTDPHCRDYDWLVVYDEFTTPETLTCPREHTILATWEPVSIKGYTRAYTRQFAHLLTNRPREAENHPGYHLGRGYYYWFNGRPYAELRGRALPPKTRDLSIVCSAKQMRRTRHHDRFSLCREIVRNMPQADWFGVGVRPIAHKYEALDDYRYHVVIENHIAAHHWSEKLADALLSECLPFYAGDPAIGEILPREAIVPIPLDDPKEALAIIRRTIGENAYETRRAAVCEAKRLLLEKYNFWTQVIAVIESAQPMPSAATGATQPATLWPRLALRRRNPLVALEDLCLHIRRGF